MKNILTTFILLVAVNVVSAQTLNDSLIAYYPFNGDASDVSGNSNHGTVYGAVPTADRFGIANSAYSFDGDSDYISYTPNQNFKPTTFPFAVTAWVKSNNDSVPGTLFKNDNQPGQYTGVIFQVNPTGTLQIYYGDGGTTGMQYRRSKISSVIVNDNHWHFVAAVVRGPQDMDIYIDGSYDAFATYDGSGGNIAYTANNGVTGTVDVVQGTFWFSGALDDIRFYHRNLTETDLQQIYNYPTSFDLLSTVAIVKGKVYTDDNQNGSWDNGEAGIQGQKIEYHFNALTYFVYTDTGGNYTLLLDTGLHTLTYAMDPDLQAGWTITNAGGAALNVQADSLAVTYGGDDFGVYIDSSYNNVGIGIWGMNPVPGFTDGLWLTAYNSGFLSNQVVVSLHYDSLLAFASDTLDWWWWGDVTPSNVDETNHVVTYTFAIAPGEWVYMDASFLCPIGTPLGTSVSSWASIAVVGGTDVDATNDTASEQTIVVGSFDPNDKQVSPPGVGASHAVNPNHVDELTYKIRFQNTGTYQAVNVVVLDTLDATSLDLSTVKLLASSHPCILEIVNGNVLKASFVNIMLADSNSNEPASHGFFSFSVKMKPNLPDFSVIHNTASIYFDFNEPVLTNDAFLTLDQHLSVERVVLPAYGVYPNPVDKLLYITKLSGAALSYRVTDLTGRVVLNGKLKSVNSPVDVSTLVPGVYTLSMDGGTVSGASRFTVIR